MITVPAGRGVAVCVAAGRRVRVVNTHGGQVVDLWAFAAAGDEHLSLPHCREVLQRIAFRPGDRLITNRYRPVLTLLADASPGAHDTLIAACSPDMYLHLTGDREHRSCTGNLAEALATVGRTCARPPDPWNLFMRARVTAAGAIEYARCDAASGDHVELRAELDAVVVLSACPDDVYPTNGGDGRARDVAVEVL